MKNILFANTSRRLTRMLIETSILIAETAAILSVSFHQFIFGYDHVQAPKAIHLPDPREDRNGLPTNCHW